MLTKKLKIPCKVKYNFVFENKNIPSLGTLETRTRTPLAEYNYEK